MVKCIVPEVLAREPHADACQRSQQGNPRGNECRKPVERQRSRCHAARPCGCVLGGRLLGVSLMPNTFAYGWDASRVARYELNGLSCPEELWYNRRAGSCPSEDEVTFVDLLRSWIAGRSELA